MKIYIENIEDKTVLAYVKNLEAQTKYDSRVSYWEDQIKQGKHRPILVSDEELNRVIDGNHTLQAYKNLGRESEVEVYAVNRLDFLNQAGKIGELEWIHRAINNGAAKKVTSEILNNLSADF